MNNFFSNAAINLDIDNAVDLVTIAIDTYKNRPSVEKIR